MLLKKKYLIIGGTGYIDSLFVKKLQKFDINIFLHVNSSKKKLSNFDFRNFVGNSSQFRKKNNWKSKNELSKGLNKTIKYFESQLNL
tara:strand:+ start:139 stop:399 length:261 start_codon:yes stop_codon:yes gene_type:complete